MDALGKRSLIRKLAGRDYIYDMYKQRFEKAEPEFQAFYDSQPPEIQQMLYNYTDSKIMMDLRLLTLACTYLELPWRVRRRIKKLQKSSEANLVL